MANKKTVLKEIRQHALDIQYLMAESKLEVDPKLKSISDDAGNILSTIDNII